MFPLGLGYKLTSTWDKVTSLNIFTLQMSKGFLPMSMKMPWLFSQKSILPNHKTKDSITSHFLSNLTYMSSPVLYNSAPFKI